jgi:hypothetical protein
MGEGDTQYRTAPKTPDSLADVRWLGTLRGALHGVDRVDLVIDADGLFLLYRPKGPVLVYRPQGPGQGQMGLLELRSSDREGAPRDRREEPMDTGARDRADRVRQEPAGTHQQPQRQPPDRNGVRRADPDRPHQRRAGADRPESSAGAAWISLCRLMWRWRLGSVPRGRLRSRLSPRRSDAPGSPEAVSARSHPSS